MPFHTKGCCRQQSYHEAPEYLDQEVTEVEPHNPLSYILFIMFYCILLKYGCRDDVVRNGGGGGVSFLGLCGGVIRGKFF